MTEYYLKQRYGEAIAVEYVDMADPQNQAEYDQLLAVVEARGLPYPLVAVNGNVQLVGTVHYYQVVPLVEAALAVETAS